MKTKLLGFLADPMEEVRVAEEQKRKQKERRYLFRQKVLGIIMFATGITALNLTNDGIIAGLFFIPIGIILIFTRGKFITEDDC